MIDVLTFYTTDYYIMDKNSDDLVKLLVPEDAEVSSYWDSLLLKLRKSWKFNGGEFPGGSLLTII